MSDIEGLILQSITELKKLAKSAVDDAPRNARRYLLLIERAEMLIKDVREVGNAQSE